MVPNLTAQYLALVKIGKLLMMKHAYIKNDFDVEKWAAPEFLAQAGKELLEAEITKKKMQKVPTMQGRVG